MDDKDYKVLIKEYEKLNASRSDIYILSFVDELALLNTSSVLSRPHQLYYSLAHTYFHLYIMI